MISVATISMLVTTSCKKSFFTDANINPNAPASVVPSALLTTVMAGLAYTQGGDLSRFTSLIDQHTLGAARQAQGYYTYTFTQQDFDTEWGNMYTTVMQNDVLLLKQADASSYNEYSAIARIILAYSLQITTDTYGDIPYSSAFQGVLELHPTYDNSSQIYTTINSLLDDAITKLAGDPGAVVPGGDDFMFGGDADKWTKFAHAIKARLNIHQSKTDASKATAALSEIALSFGSNDDNAAYPFIGNSETAANPWYQFNEQRGDISFATSTLAEDLESLKDPRGVIFIDTSGDGSGFGLAAYYGSITSPVEFICYDELQFMKAEAILRSGGSVSDAQAAYQAGIQANMDKLGVDAAASAAYIAANGTLPSDNAGAIAQVAFQEWIALYLNPEAWTVYRRTGSPALVGINNADVPRRLLYPQSEYSYNGGNTPASTLYSPRVFWDN